MCGKRASQSSQGDRGERVWPLRVVLSSLRVVGRLNSCVIKKDYAMLTLGLCDSPFIMFVVTQT